MEQFDLRKYFDDSEVLSKFKAILESLLHIIRSNAKKEELGEIWTRSMENGTKFLILRFKGISIIRRVMIFSDEICYWELNEKTNTFDKKRVVPLTSTDHFIVDSTRSSEGVNK